MADCRDCRSPSPEPIVDGIDNSESSSDFTLFCSDLDSFLNKIELTPSTSETRSCSELRACADANPVSSAEPTSNDAPSSSTSRSDRLSSAVFKEFAAPSTIRCFNRQIEVNSPIKQSKTVEFRQQPNSSPSDCRLPRQLQTCYNVFVENLPPVVEDSKKIRGRRRFGRNSLLRRQSENDDCFLKQNVLPTTDDLRYACRNAFHRQTIPFIYPCVVDNDDCVVKCSNNVDKFHLFVEVKQDSLRTNPIIQKIVDKNDGLIDEASAVVAVSAVRSKNSTSRWFLPVDDSHKKDLCRFVDETKPQLLPIDDDVKQIVDDVLNFVDQQSAVELNYDPDLSSVDDSSSPSPTKRRIKRRREKNAVIRELKRLINVSVADERDLDDDVESTCSKLSCVLGCVCNFSKRAKPNHCRRIDCMFGCECSLRFRPRPTNLPGELAKIEKTWHQTIIRKNNDDVELLSEIERSKREKKPPNRFENDDIMSLTTIRRAKHKEEVKMKRRVDKNERALIQLSNNKRKWLEKYKVSVDVDTLTLKQLTNYDPRVELKDIVKSQKLLNPDLFNNSKLNVKVSHGFKKKFEYMKRKFATRRFKNCEKGSANRLGDVLIWCTVHSKYDCLCANWVLSSRNNNLAGKPEKSRGDRLSIYKSLIQTQLTNTEKIGRKVIMFDRTKFCSRTFGSFFDYNRRNASHLYTRLNSFKLSRNVPSYSNGYFKAQPLATMASEEPILNHPLNPDATSGVGVGKVVKIWPHDNEVIVDIEALVTETVQDLTLSSSDDDCDDYQQPSTKYKKNRMHISFDSDYNLELVPKPNTPHSVPLQQPGFSSYPTLLRTKPIRKMKKVSANVQRNKKTAVKTHTVKPVCDPNDSDDDVQVIEVRPPSPIVIEDDNYPAHGIVCMTRPEFGYIVVRFVAAGQVVIEDPEDSSLTKVFQDPKTACAYVKSFMVERVDDNAENLSWSLVTRGILEKYQCQEFDRTKIKKCKLKKVDDVDVVTKKQRVCTIDSSPLQQTTYPSTVNKSLGMETLHRVQQFSGLKPDLNHMIVGSDERNGKVFIRLAPHLSSSPATKEENNATLTVVNSTPCFTKIVPNLPSQKIPTITVPSGETPAVKSRVIASSYRPKNSQCSSLKPSYGPRPLKIRLPPRRADVIIPRSDGFATLISPAPLPPKPQSPTKTPCDVFKGILITKNPINNVKGYICDKTAIKTKTNFRSLLQKR